VKTGVYHKSILAATILLVLGCGEDIDRFVPDPYVKLEGDIDHFYEASRENITQTTTINIEFPTAVVTRRKTVLIFQPNSLLDPAGNMVTGNVEIKIMELLTKGEILLYGIPTSSKARLLSSGGEFFVTASQDGLPLSLKESMPVRILTDVSGANPEQRTELFYGQAEDHEFMDSIYTWIEADGNPDTWSNVDITEWVALADSQQIITGFGYESFSDRLNWISLEEFVNIPPNDRTGVCVSLPPEYGDINTAVFLIFHQRHSIIALPWNFATRQFCNYYGQNEIISVPIGTSATFVVVSSQGGGRYFFARVVTTLERDFEISIHPVETPLGMIKDAISKL
jgi:hypothetical protein